MYRDKQPRDLFEREADRLNRLATEISFVYIKTPDVRFAFNHEISLFINHLRISSFGEFACNDSRYAIESIQEEIVFLEKQKSGLMFKRVYQYAVAQRMNEEDAADKRWKLVLANVGFVSGGGQAIAGLALRSLSSKFGMALMAHGVSNMHENGSYLLFRKEVPGFVKHFYRYVSHTVGYGDKEADFVFAGIDLALSGYGLVRPVLKPDAWRLFHRMNSDYIRGWNTMSKPMFALEFIGDANTIYGVYK